MSTLVCRVTAWLDRSTLDHFPAANIMSCSLGWNGYPLTWGSFEAERRCLKNMFYLLAATWCPVGETKRSNDLFAALHAVWIKRIFDKLSGITG
jgi:hypothetical protein